LRETVNYKCAKFERVLYVACVAQSVEHQTFNLRV
jgi:hypothetical protein